MHTHTHSRGKPNSVHMPQTYQLFRRLSKANVREKDDPIANEVINTNQPFKWRSDENYRLKNNFFSTEGYTTAQFAIDSRKQLQERRENYVML
jgi:hypothetical protein